MSDFQEQIKKFNDMYSIPSNDNLTNLGVTRLNNFINILKEEIEEYKVKATTQPPWLACTTFLWTSRYIVPLRLVGGEWTTTRA